jgi:GPH family glycoside/pentoside/hexuronide:cation symporter
MLNVAQVGYTGQIHLAISLNIALAASMPLWVRAGRSIGKRNTYLSGVVIFCIGALSWLLVDGAVSVAGIWVRGLISGVGSGAIILMAISMLSDTMAYDRALTGQAREGLMSSLIAVIEKTAFALGVLLFGVLLQAMGYVPSVGGALVAQPESAIQALYLGYAVIPALMFALNGVFLLFYDLDEKRMRAAQALSAT